MGKYSVPKSAITEKGLKKLIRDAAKDNASLSEWAIAHKITPQQVSAFFRKRQGAGLKIPEALGYRPQIVYLPVDEDEISTPMPSRRATPNPSKKTDQTKEPVEKAGRVSTSAREETKTRLKARKK
jgi:hypothetical protein